jgi:hypothetical protein
MHHLSYIIIVIVIVIVKVIVTRITRKKERAYALRTLNGLPLQMRLGGGRRTQNRLLITTNRTDGGLGGKPQLRIGERVPEIVSGETNNQKETNQ